MKKDIGVLRNHLFEQLERLAQANTNEELETEVQRSASIVQVADSILRSAKEETEFIKATNALPTGFISQDIRRKERQERPLLDEFLKD